MQVESLQVRTLTLPPFSALKSKKSHMQQIDPLNSQFGGHARNTWVN